MSFDDSIHSLVDPDDENGWNTMYGPFTDDADREYERYEASGQDSTQAFYPDWDGPSEDVLSAPLFEGESVLNWSDEFVGGAET